MGLQGFEGCDIPCEPGWQLQATDADCAEEDGGPIRPMHGCGEHWTGGAAGTPSMLVAQVPASETPP